MGRFRTIEQLRSICFRTFYKFDTMQIKLFTIPIPDSDPATEVMNKFMEGKRILKISQHLLNIEQGAFLCFCIQYEEEESGHAVSQQSGYFSNPTQESHHRRFELLSSLRDKIAAEDGELPHRVFTDDEIIAFAKLEEPLSIGGMKKMRGIGNLKAERYGHRLLKMLQEELDKRYE
jgi:superfamily II DNA helicase RecQ